jgi:hypothetical protein
VTESARERERVREFTKLYLTEKPKSSVACMSAPALYNISSTAMSPEYAACVYREREINIEKERERRRERGSAKGRVLQRRAKLSKVLQEEFRNSYVHLKFFRLYLQCVCVWVGGWVGGWVFVCVCVSACVWCKHMYRHSQLKPDVRTFCCCQI